MYRRLFGKVGAWRYVILAAFFTAAMTNTAATAEAAENCGSRENVLKLLARDHTELRAAAGLDRQGHLVEVWSTYNGSTWTITVTDPAGKTCLLAVGSDWHRLPRSKLDPEV